MLIQNYNIFLFLLEVNLLKCAESSSHIYLLPLHEGMKIAPMHTVYNQEVFRLKLCLDDERTE